MSSVNRISRFLFTLVLAVSVLGIAAQPLSAQVAIPEGSSIDEAVFSIYVVGASNQTVNVHRITADWGENFVTWNSFGGSYDGFVWGSFQTDTTGWRSVDITALVQGWIDGIYPNHGIVIKQNPTPYNRYIASEYDMVPCIFL